MPNPTSSSSSSSRPELRDAAHLKDSVSSTLKDSISSGLPHLNEKFSQVKSQASDFAEQASDMASEFYNDASTWLSSNKGRVITGAAILSAVGVFGYYLARRRSNILE